MFLLDTNVFSDATKLQPHPDVTRWLGDQPAPTLFISAMSVAEAGYGVERLAPGQKADRLRAWLEEVIADFGERVLAVDAEVAKAQARIRRSAENARRTMPSIDAFLAATAEVHGLTLVTRNVRDFEAWGGPILDPWGA
ncbi:VapC toxin family PIN domain ribonuclease [Caulobacter flavus]|uniref:Ribonuclease VapC n=1 Tax=Caulobacter flavus TaxID=1679497 RepID=A0A2N5CZP3_9CAUL|nr:type II toxin-antitoxin system VapC family toxin [Caulobacter flavus]AYV45063.1 VapC toxin family PIN domain ribonuclease [Caulobacter flavus]PLR19255.1 VapC toxin family PIN domain ribonuclease [Caulobacter flavus]